MMIPSSAGAMRTAPVAFAPAVGRSTFCRRDHDRAGRYRAGCRSGWWVAVVAVAAVAVAVAV
jgi:hypothetical protein